MTDYERWCKAFDNAKLCGTNVDAEYFVLLREERKEQEKKERKQQVPVYHPGKKIEFNWFLRTLQAIGIISMSTLVVYLIYIACAKP